MISKEMSFHLNVHRCGVSYTVSRVNSSVQVVHWDVLLQQSHSRFKMSMFHVEQVLAIKVNTPAWTVCALSILLVSLVYSRMRTVANYTNIFASYALQEPSLQHVEEGPAKVCRDSPHLFS